MDVGAVLAETAQPQSGVRGEVVPEWSWECDLWMLVLSEAAQPQRRALPWRPPGVPFHDQLRFRQALKFTAQVCMQETAGAALPSPLAVLNLIFQGL